MNSNEVGTVEVIPDSFKAHAKFCSLSVSGDFDIVAPGPNARDFGSFEKIGSSLGTKSDDVGDRRCIGRSCKLKATGSFCKCLLQSLAGDGFHEIINGVIVESTSGKLCECRHENNQRFWLGQHSKRRKAVWARHIDVQQDHVGAQDFQAFCKLDTVGKLPDQHTVFAHANKPAQPRARNGLVVGNDNSDRVQTGISRINGWVTMT